MNIILVLFENTRDYIFKKNIEKWICIYNVLLDIYMYGYTVTNYSIQDSWIRIIKSYDISVTWIQLRNSNTLPFIINVGTM